jgi:hypothetical protein
MNGVLDSQNINLKQEVESYKRKSYEAEAKLKNKETEWKREKEELNKLHKGQIGNLTEQLNRKDTDYLNMTLGQLKLTKFSKNIDALYASAKVFTGKAIPKSHIEPKARVAVVRYLLDRLSYITYALQHILLRLSDQVEDEAHTKGFADDGVIIGHPVPWWNKIIHFFQSGKCFDEEIPLSKYPGDNDAKSVPKR